MRKLVIGVVLAFFVFYLLSQPAGAAEAVRGAVAAVAVAFTMVIEFATTLFA